MSDSEEIDRPNDTKDDSALTMDDIIDVTPGSGESMAIHNSRNKEQVHHEILYTVMTYISGILYYLSTCINPLLYNLMSNKFRQAFKCILFGKDASNTRGSQNSQRSLSHKPTTNLSSTHRNSCESEMQSKASLLQTITNERKTQP